MRERYLDHQMPEVKQSVIGMVDARGIFLREATWNTMTPRLTRIDLIECFS